jgi:tetratricopeptide (TPR) repeat protein
MREKSPRAAQLFQEGEALVAKGALAEAEAIFQRGHEAYPEGSLLWRRDCEMRTAMGQRKEAILACSEALERLHSGISERALASAFIDGPSPPTNGDLYQAWLVMDRARNNPLGQVTLAATKCDLAERIGDGIMLQQCSDELGRIAPNDSATKRASAALSAFGPRAGFWIGWGAVLAAVLLTLIDAFRQMRLRRRPGAPAAVLLASLLCTLVTLRADAKPTPGANLSKWPVNLDNPEDGIPNEKDRNEDPLNFGYWLQDVAANAEIKSKAGDHETAAKLWAALGKAVPDRAVSYIKLCEEYELMGDLTRATSACGDALLRDGLRVQDYTHFVKVMLAKPGELREKDVKALDAVLDHMKADPGGRDFVPDLECQVGAKTSNVAQLRECTTVLSVRAPDDAKTVTYLWALALAEGRFDDARKLGDRAKAAGVSGESVAAMERLTAANEARHRRTLVSLAAAALFAAGLAFLSRKLWRLYRRQPELATHAS